MRETYQKLVDEGYSTRKMAKKLGVGQTTIKYWMKKFGIKTNPHRYIKKDGKVFKPCPQCKAIKEINFVNFYPKGKKGYSSYCKKCFSIYCSNRWIQKKKDAVKYKGGICIDCKSTFDYYLYDFHHLDSNTKEFDWNKLRLYGWNRIKSELDKCVLLCCMCHRRREQIHL